jgi:GntR family phosphonate transport system transcriptional regulator
MTPSHVRSAQRTPLWQSIATTLASEIDAGHFLQGEKLPTEADLARRFGVNRHTVRHAVASLAADGMVHSRRGSGVFVAATPTDYPIGRRVRFHQALAAAGRIPGREILAIRTRPADQTEAEALHLSPGARVHSCEGRSLADGHPVAVFHSVFPADRLPDLPAALWADASVTRALAQCGIPDYLRASTRLTATAASATQALHLRMSEGAPLLLSVAINTDPEGRPIEFGTTWFAGDRVTLTVKGDDPPSR